MVLRQQYADEEAFIANLSQKYLKPTVAPAGSQVAAPEEEEKDDGGFGVSDVIGGVTNAVGTVIDASGKYLARPIAGAASKAQAYIPTNIQNQIERVESMVNPGDLLGLGFNPMDEEERKRIKEADSFTEAFRINMEDENWLNQLVFEVGLDPTTYIGAGLFARAAKVPTIAAKLAQGGDFADRFYRLQNAANIFEEIQALPVTAPLQGLKAGVKKGGKLVGLGDEALELTDRSKLNEAQENFHRATSAALDRGLNTTETLDAANSLQRVETRNFIERLNAAATGPTQGPDPVVAALRASDDDTILRAWQEMSPTDPAYDRTKNWLKSRGMVSETTTPAATNVTAQLQPFLSTMTPAQARPAAAWTSTTTSALRGNASGILKAQLDQLDMNKVGDRRKAGWLWNQVETGGIADPNKLVETEFVNRGWATQTPSTTTVAETPRFTTAATNAEQRRAARAVLAADANLTDVLSFRANELARNPQYAGLQPADVQARVQSVQNILEPVIGLNPEHFQARELWDISANKRWIDEALSSTDEMTQRRALRNMLMEMNQTKSAQGVMHPHWFLNKDSWLGKRLDLSTKRTRNQQRGMVGGRGVNNSVLNPDDLAELEAGGSLQQVRDLQDTYNSMRAEVADVLERNATSGLTRPFDDLTSAQDLTDAAARLAQDPATAADAKKITDFLTKFDMTQEAIDKVAGKMGRTRARSTATLDTYRVRDAYLDTLMDTHFRAKARELGVDLTKFENESVWSWFPRAWREQALISPRYHLANVMDMTVKSAFNGVNPVKPAGAARDQVSRWGMELDPRIFVGREQTDLQGLLRRQQGPQGPNIYGNATSIQPNMPEFADMADRSALPGVLGKISKWNRRLARASENSFREAAYVQGMRDHLTLVRPRFDNLVRETMGNTAPTQRILNDLNLMGNGRTSNLGIDFSAEDVRRVALHRGATTEQADAIATMWGRQLDEASTAGVQMSNNIHFAMNKEYKIEERLKLRGWMPFHFFATRNLPFYLETLATHPPMLDVIETYYDLSDEERNGLGLSGQSRLGGMVPLPSPLNDLMETVFGPGKIFFNPMVLISFMDQTKNFGRAFQENPYETGDDLSGRERIGQNVERLGSVGLSLAPWIQIPASALGFFGEDDETMPVLRHSQLIQGLSGGRTSLGEDTFRGLVDEVREVTTQTTRDTKTGSAYKDNQIVNLLAEWSVKNTGGPQHPDYIAASEEGPGNELWDRAQKEVERRMFRQNALGMVVPVPMKGVSDVGQAVARTEQGLGITPEFKANDANDPVMDALVRQGNLATTYRGYDRTYARDLKGSGGANSGPNETSWGGDVWGPTMPAPFNNKKLHQAYTRWKGNQPEKSDTSPLSFLMQYGIR